MVKEVTGRYTGAMLVLLAVLAGCGGGAGEGGQGRARAGAGDAMAGAGDARASAGDVSADAAAERPVVLVVGTSLTAGLGVDPSEAYPARLQERIDSAGLPYRVVNAGVSGETSAGALARLDWLLQQEPAVVVVETGANDGLRGLDAAALKANLTAIVERTRAAVPGVRIAIVQMEAPPNLGRRYTDEFRAAYTEVARDQGATLLPFPLADVAGIDSLNQPDGIHPTRSGHERMARALWPTLEALLRDALRARPAARP